MEIMPSADGAVRAVNVKRADGDTKKYPVSNLYPLELSTLGSVDKNVPGENIHLDADLSDSDEESYMDAVQELDAASSQADQTPVITRSKRVVRPNPRFYNSDFYND